MLSQYPRHADFDASTERARWIANRFGRVLARHLAGQPNPCPGKMLIPQGQYKNPYAERFLRGERIGMNDIQPQWMRHVRREAWETHRETQVQAMLAMGAPLAAEACRAVEYNDYAISGRMGNYVA